MNSKLTVAIAMAAGLAGGLLSRYIAPAPVLAQNQPPAPKEIRAQSFVLVNQQGTAFGFLGFSPKGEPVIKLLDAQGKTLWSTEPFVRLPSE
jgi:hypothetical protein